MPGPTDSAVDLSTELGQNSTNEVEQGSVAEQASVLAVKVTGRTPPARKSFALERALVNKLYEMIGRPQLQIALWDDFLVGDQQSPAGRISILRPHVLRRLLVNPALYFGEDYAANEITIDGDLVDVLTEVNRGLARVAAPRSWPRFLRIPWTGNSFSKSKASVYHHYDIGNEFYQLWLDRQLVYTCAYYGDPDATLEQAQIAKLDYVCRKLRLRPGETVVEAGCGWGALAMHMASKYGVNVRAFNLSREQLAYARDRAQAEGLSDRIEFIEDDYRNIQTRCDAFVSVGMLEHVGVENYRVMGQMIGRILSENGRGLIHSIGRNYPKPLDPWTLKYIFPGAYAPSLREMMDIFESSHLSVLDVENLRPHYARTCAEWLARFNASADRVEQMFDRRFVRMWRLYLASSTATFLSGDLQLFQVVFTRDRNNELPWTREDWYTSGSSSHGNV